MQKKQADKITALIRIAVGLLLFMGTYYIYKLVIYPNMQSQIPDLLHKFLTSIIVPYAIGFPLLLLVVWNMPKDDKANLEPIGVKGFLKYFVVQSGISVLVVIIISIVLKVLFDYSNPLSLDLKNNLWFYIFLLLIFNPIMEEVIFRKVVLARLQPYGDKFSIIMSALLFALIHVASQGIPALFCTFVLGCVWAYVTIRTGNIWCAVILHSLSNVWNFFLPMLMTKTKIGNVIYTLIWCIAMPIAAIIIIAVNRKKSNIKLSDVSR